jgi:hypothetical protein
MALRKWEREMLEALARQTPEQRAAEIRAGVEFDRVVGQVITDYELAADRAPEWRHDSPEKRRRVEQARKSLTGWQRRVEAVGCNPKWLKRVMDDEPLQGWTEIATLGVGVNDDRNLRKARAALLCFQQVIRKQGRRVVADPLDLMNLIPIWNDRQAGGAGRLRAAKAAPRVGGRFAR